VIPEIWYELLRFVGRYSEDYEWRWYEDRLAWIYCELGWSLPHQLRPTIRVLLAVTQEASLYTHPDLQHIWIEEAIMRSDPSYAV
jgi:hypothetical protein